MRRVIVAASISTLLLAVSAAPATAATNVSNYAQLVAAVSDCGSGPVVLASDVSELNANILDIPCDVTIDLNGFELKLSSMQVLDNVHLTISDSQGDGTLDAREPISYQAGIRVEDSAQLTITGGEILVAGGYYAAGIGGNGNASASGDAGTITITGTANVTARGERNAAGIGGGIGGNGGTVTISGNATVSATSVSFGGPGIGGGYGGNGGHVAITDNADVTAIGVSYGAGIGNGGVAQDDEGHGGTVIISGNANVTARSGLFGAGIGGGSDSDGANVVIIENATVTAAGQNNTSAIGSGLRSSVFGSLTLQATLYVDSSHLAVPDSNTSGEEIKINGGQLLSASTDPTTGVTITGGGQILNGGVIALDESLVNVDVSGHNFVVTFDAQDGSATEHVHLFAPNFDVSYRDWIAPPAANAWNTADDGSGDWFTASTTLTGDTTVFAATGPATDITLSAPTTTVDQGDSLTFTITATDVNGNPVNTADAVLTSSVPTDIISGTTVTFVDASPHVITATLGDAQDSVTVEVTPAAVPDPTPTPTPDPTPTPEPTPTPTPAPAPDPDGEATPDVEPAPDTTPTPAATLASGTGSDELSATGTNPATSGFGILALLLLAAGSALLVTRRSITR